MSANCSPAMRPTSTGSRSRSGPSGTWPTPW